MKIRQTIVLFAAAMLMFSCQDKKADEVTVTKPTNDADKMSYALGYDIGNSFLRNLTKDSVKVNLDYVFAGIREGLLNDTTKQLVSREEMANAMTKLQEEMQAKEEAKVKLQQQKYEERKKTAAADGEKFLNENKSKPGVVTDPKTGLQHKVLVEGKGPKPTENDMIRFHIVGKFIDGEEFQSTREMPQPPEVPLNQMALPALHDAFKNMTAGSKWEVYAPYKMAYGEEENGVIPPKSTIIFELELLDVVKPEAKPVPAPSDAAKK